MANIPILILGVVIAVIGIFMAIVAWHLANQIILPTGSANWTASNITLLIAGIIFFFLGFGLFIYSFYIG